MIIGRKVARPTKEQIVADIASACGLPAPNVSSGSSVDVEFLDAVYIALTGEANPGNDAYRKTEALLDSLGLTYDPYWDTSESSPTGGSTVTTRAYSRMRAAILGVPRCFLLNVSDAPIGARWERNHEEVYRYDTNVTAHRPINDAGPGSRVIYYATRNSSNSPMHFVATATVEYVAEGWEGPWEARLEGFSSFPSPIPVSEFEMEGWNRQHAITEITYETYLELTTVAGLAADTDVPAGADLGDLQKHDPGGADAAEKVMSEFPVETANPTILIPESLPEGHLDAADAQVPGYAETEDGHVVGSGAANPKSQSKKSDKLAEERAIELVKKAMKSAGWTLTADRQKDGVGYDLEFEKNDKGLHLEVKGVQGSQVAFNLTPKEFWRAQTDDQWIVVAVTSVLSPAAFKLNVVTRDQVVVANRVVTGFRITF